METQRLTDETDIAAEILRGGGLVAVPTETVYGLAANGLDSDAVRKIYEVKGRPETKPISLLISDMSEAEKFTQQVPQTAYKLAKRFWPGPLTMVLRKSEAVPDIVTAGGATVGVRCPAHAVTLAIIKAAGVPLATPSANISGQPSPKNAPQVLDYFDGKIEAVVDGGECSVGIESTVVDMTCDPPQILRQGGISADELFAALGCGTDAK